MNFKGWIFFLLLLVSISSGQEKRSLFDDIIPTTKLTKRHFEVETPQQKLCDGRRNSQPCSNEKKVMEGKDQPSSSLFDQFPKMSEPMKGKENSHQSASTSPKTSEDISKYVPAPYPGQNSSQSLFDEYITIEAPSLPAPRNSRPSSGIGWQDFASKTKSTSSSSSSRRHEEQSSKTGSTSSLGKNGVSKSRNSIMEKEKEALENLSNYVWKEALQTSRFERDSSKDDLDQIANSAQKLKHMMDGDFQNDDADPIKLSTKQIDRSFSDSGDRRKLSNQDLRSLAKLLNKSGNQVSEDSFPETKQSFVPFLDEIKANRLKDLRLALKLMKSIQRAKDHRYAGNTRSEDFELNLAQLLFDSNIQSLQELTRPQRDSLDVLMKKMENTLQSSTESSENRASLSQLLDESESDFNVGFFRPPTPLSDPSRAYETPPRPSGLYGTPTPTRRPPIRPPPPSPPPTRPPSPPPPRPPSPPTPRPVGPPAPPPAVVRPVGPPSVGPPAIRPSQEEPLFLSTDFDDDDDSFFLAPSQAEALESPSLDEEDIWTPMNPSAPPLTYGTPNEGRGPTSSADASSQANHNYHYHYHTLTINQNRRDFNARPKSPRLPTASRDVGRVRRPVRLPLSPPRRPSTSSYSSLESLPVASALPAAPPVTFQPNNPTAYGPPQAAPPEPSYGAPPRDPVPTYSPPSAEPAPIYGAPRDPPAPPPPPFRYGPPPADPPAPAYGPPPSDPTPQYRPPPRDPAPTYGPPPADPPPMTYGPPPPRDPEPPPRTQTRVVFLSPVKEKKKEKFWKKDKSGGNFNAFSVLFDEGTGLSRQSDDFQQPRDVNRGSLRDDYSNRRDDLRDQFWRNRERLFRQQQEAFDLQRLRLEIDLQERQRKEMKRNLFRNLLRDERDTGGGGITSMFYKGVQALGAMALMPITNLMGRKKRDLTSQPMADSLFYSENVEFENFPLKFQNLYSSKEK